MPCFECKNVTEWHRNILGINLKYFFLHHTIKDSTKLKIKIYTKKLFVSNLLFCSKWLLRSQVWILLGTWISCFFRFFAAKTLKMTISTSVWSAQHPNAGQNIQHTHVRGSHPFRVGLTEEIQRRGNPRQGKQLTKKNYCHALPHRSAN